MATLKDVAKLACVDVSTVSRALNNTSYVHPDTKARIMAAVKELSYQPNLLAKGLREGKRNTIGVVVPRLSFSIFSSVVSGIEEEARKSGYATLICTTGDEKEVEKESLNRLRNGFIDGLIIAGTGGNKRLIRDINAGGIPVTQVIREQDPSLCSVVVDNKKIGYDATVYLINKGCTRIGLINGSMEIAPYADRYFGYRKAVGEYHLEEITAEKESKLRSMKYGYDCTLQLIDRYSRLDAILAATDSQGMGCIRALKENGYAVPGMIRVLSMTGHHVGDMLETTLTSMELPGYEIGQRAADMTIQAIEHGGKKRSLQHLSFLAVMDERESTQ